MKLKHECNCPHCPIARNATAKYICESCGGQFDIGGRPKAKNGAGTNMTNLGTGSWRWSGYIEEAHVASPRFCSSLCYGWPARKSKWRKQFPELSDEELFAQYRAYLLGKEKLLEAKYYAGQFRDSLMDTTTNVY